MSTALSPQCNRKSAHAARHEYIGIIDALTPDQRTAWLEVFRPAMECGEAGEATKTLVALLRHWDRLDEGVDPC